MCYGGLEAAESIIGILSLALLHGCGCSRELDSPSSPDPETGAQRSSGATADTGPVVDTGPPPGPGCGGLPASACVHLTGNHELDYAGRWVDVGDVDGDGVDEVMISESASWWITYTNTVQAAVHVLKRPEASGTLANHSWLRIDGPVDTTFPYWGHPSALLAGSAQVALHDVSEGDYYVKLFDVPSTGGVRHPGDDVGRIYVPGPYNAFGFTSQLAVAIRGLGARRCASPPSIRTWRPWGISQARSSSSTPR